MKKGLKLLMLGAGILLTGSLGVKNAPKMVKAEESISSSMDAPKSSESILSVSESLEEKNSENEIVEEGEAIVTIGKTSHGTVSVDIEKGKAGDVCTITAKHDLFYLVEFVKVNGNQIIEDEETSGLYKFLLVAGDNKIEVKFSIDKELCGDLSNIVAQAEDKDWTNLFSLENVVTLVKWLLDGGILIAMLRYYIRDKRLESKLEANVRSTLDTIIPEVTKQVVIDTVKEVLAPIFSALQADNIETQRVMSVFAKCMALSQQDTKESKIAILDELSNLKIGNLSTIEEVKEYIEQQVALKIAAYQENLAKLTEIGESNKSLMEEKIEIKKELEELEEVGQNQDDGVQIG